MKMTLKILFFTSPTCSWCPFIEQVLGRIVEEAKHLTLEIIDITKNIEKAEELEIVAIPTIILPNNQRIIGAADETFIREQLDFFLVMG